MNARKPSNSQPVQSLDELQLYLWIARYYNPSNINNRREQIRAIVDDRYVIATGGHYEIVDPFFYKLLIRDNCLFRAKSHVTLITKQVRFVTARMDQMEEFDITELDPEAVPCTVVVDSSRHIDSETIEVLLRRVSP